MQKRKYCLLFFLFLQLVLWGQHYDLSKVIYEMEDSVLVEKLLRTDIASESTTLRYARFFLGRPYVAHTLEKADPEQLVVNLRELDCTTIVETVGALTRARSVDIPSFADFCQALERLRYWGGKINGYCSRLHYFTWWMHDNLSKSEIIEISDSIYTTTPLVVNNYYMSLYPDKYAFLKNNPERVTKIKALEKKYNKPDGCYIAARYLNRSKSELGFIKDGDIIAIVTAKRGLDYSHLGFAVWGKDGKLHMLHASSVKKKVVEDVIPLYDYLRKQPSALGIRVFRFR